MASIPKKKRLFVAERAYSCCEYCISQEKYSPDYFSVEHIIPQIKDGTDEVLNLAYSCLACNSHKYISTKALDPVSGIIYPLYNPRTDTWASHFRWSVDYTQILGITPTGRATIEKLRLNRPNVINLRVVLSTIGKHPPY